MSSQTSTNSAWELSLYELHRKPHEMVSDTSAIAVSPRALHSELMCPICLDLMKNTMTTKDCLHRFCNECITTALRSGNKECPTCRKKLVSKRNLRRDVNFDKLIAKIYPNREELNAQQEKQTNRRSQPIHRRKRKLDSPDREGHREGEGRRESAINAEKRMRREELDDEGDSVSPPPTDSSESIELQLRPHPGQENLESTAIKNLVSSPLCTVSHLIRYIGLHLNEEGGKEGQCEYALHVQMGESYTSLPGSTSLKQISNTYWTSGEKLKLFYSCKEGGSIS